MKKTLITLAALAMASVASAALESTTVSNLTTGGISDTALAGEDGSYTLILTTNWKNASTNGGTDSWEALFRLCVNTSATQNGNWWLSGLGINNTTIPTEDGGTENAVAIQLYENAAVANSGFTLTKAEYESDGVFTLALSYDHPTNVLTLYALKNDGTIGATSTATFGWGDLSSPQNHVFIQNAYDGLFESAVVYNDALSEEQIIGVAVPEPTTATLSLLALAGLAARRRRK